MNWIVPEMWADETVYIIGGGPSILWTPLDAIHGRPVIGVNNAFTLGPWVDIIFFGDMGWWERERLNVLRHPGIVVTCLPGDKFKDIKRVKQVPRDKVPGLHIRTRNKVNWNENSGGAAVNLAVLLGASRIVLLGFDFKTDKERGFRQGHNWHNFHTGGPAQDIYRSKFLKGFRQMAKDLESMNAGGWHRGVEILNATPGSALDVFPMVALEDTL
jgi:uncharacterized Rossmann fold enzyme